MPRNDALVIKRTCNHRGMCTWTRIAVFTPAQASKLLFNIHAFILFINLFLHVRNQVYQWNMQKINISILWLWRLQSLTHTVWFHGPPCEESLLLLVWNSHDVIMMTRRLALMSWWWYPHLYTWLVSSQNKKEIIKSWSKQVAEVGLLVSNLSQFCD